MTRKLFGTDGIRGTANTHPMTADMALKLAQATALVLNRGDHRHKVVIGKDTRLSGYMIEPALVSGFTSMGLDVVLVGPMPTPAVAMLTKSLRADLGVMISASHNPYQDNGIKLFGADGYKLSDDIEMVIEACIEDDLSDKFVTPENLGRARRLDDAAGRYIEFVKNTFPKRQRLDGMKIVIDCAHGAAYKVAPQILYELGADVIPIGVNPNGTNINRNCGATHTDALSEAVVLHHADIGIALDGDADRVIICDEKGDVIDGDQLMALIVCHMMDCGDLESPKLAATVMSNLGLERHLKSKNIELVRTAVGDRYVVEKMRADKIQVGGEQSGHIILSEHGTTGDGLVAGLAALSVLGNSGEKASDVFNVFEPVPQILKNVRVSDKSVLDSKAVQAAIKAKIKEIGDKGRLLTRPSGTEPLIRVMAEGDDHALVEQWVDDICNALKKHDNQSEDELQEAV